MKSEKVETWHGIIISPTQHVQQSREGEMMIPCQLSTFSEFISNAFKRFQVSMVSSFHPHIMCNKVERLTVKTGCTSCTKQTISFEVSGFHTETRLLQRDFISFELLTFCVFKMHHSKPHHHFSILSDFICYFSCIY